MSQFDFGATMAAQHGIQSIEVGMALLKALASSGHATALKDLAAAASMPAAKAHRYLVSLTRAGMVEQDRGSGHYRLGPLALNIGLTALTGLDVMRYAGEALDDLLAATGETVLLAVWSDRGPVVVRWEDGPRPVATNIRLGSMMPLLNSSTGRVFAAFLPDEKTAKILEREAAAQPELARGYATVRRRTREAGIGQVDGDLLPGIAALSAPIFDYQADLVAVMTVLGHRGSLDDRVDGPIWQTLKQVSTGLSRRLGFVKPSAA